MKRYSEGDLRPGTARIGLKVRCVILPDMSLWLLKYQHLNLVLPELGKLYSIRANVHAATHAGILLLGIKNSPVNLSDMISGEPFFAHRCFNMIP